MSPTRRISSRALLGLLAFLAPLLIASASASAAIKINEIESSDAELADYVELTNTGPGEVDTAGMLLTDSDPTHVETLGAGVLPPGGFLLIEPTFQLGTTDAAVLYASGGATVLDSYEWSAHSETTFGRCPDGIGPIGDTLGGTPGSANNCPMTDIDEDGVVDGVDNCPTVANLNQANRDSDASGDACDADDDNDGVLDASDACRIGQLGAGGDTDGDGCKAAEDPDDDGDGRNDATDNCPSASNPTQADIDGDGRGDACDPLDDRACDAAREKLKQAKAKLKKAKDSGKQKKIKKAKKKVKRAQAAVDDAC